MMYSMVRLLTASLMLLLVVGCGPVKVPQVTQYSLSLPLSDIEPSSAGSQTRLSLLVNQPVAAAGYDTNRIVYTRQPMQLQTYKQHQWVASPTHMLMQMFAQQIQQTGYFHAVLMPPFAGVSDYRLETRLIMLQQQYVAEGSQVNLAIWAGLINSQSHQVIANRLFRITLPAAANVYNGVQVANQAALELSRQISAFVVTQLRRQPSDKR